MFEVLCSAFIYIYVPYFLHSHFFKFTTAYQLLRIVDSEPCCQCDSCVSQKEDERIQASLKRQEDNTREMLLQRQHQWEERRRDRPAETAADGRNSGRGRQEGEGRGRTTAVTAGDLESKGQPRCALSDSTTEGKILVIIIFICNGWNLLAPHVLEQHDSGSVGGLSAH